LQRKQPHQAQRLATSGTGYSPLHRTPGAALGCRPALDADAMLRLLLLLAMLTPLPVMAHNPSVSGGQFVSRVILFEGQSHRYQVFVPVMRDAAPLPIVLFLHGSGERGNDGDAPTRAGLGPWLREQADQFPALVVFPQAATNEEWLGRNARLALATLDAASQEFGADASRTYLTGMSMGGYGVWELALMQPQRFAALAPVCAALLPPRAERPSLRVEQLDGSTDPYRSALSRLEGVPIWMFHGALDDLVPPHDARKLYQMAKEIHAPVRYSEYPDTNHNAWDPTYRNLTFWDWLFAQHRR
jgi:predicted peptidase